MVLTGGADAEQSDGSKEVPNSHGQAPQGVLSASSLLNNKDRVSSESGVDQKVCRDKMLESIATAQSLGVSQSQTKIIFVKVVAPHYVPPPEAN